MLAANLRQLTTPAVRDLAFLLCSPSPWLNAADIDCQRLLGNEGWPQLLALDAAPAPLLAELAAHPLRRLGFYAEQLLGYWFRHAPHCQLLAANLPLRDGQQTVGEFDFLLNLDGVALHLETASKFYLQLADGSAAWVGASLRDALLLKAAKTQQQLQLSRHPAARLPTGFAACEVAARTTGWLFFPAAQADFTVRAPLNPLANRGWWTAYDSAWPQQDAAHRWCHLPRLRWLSPARLATAETLTQTALREVLQPLLTPQLVAEVQQQADGAWEEVARGFVVPQGWPQAELLAPLLARLP